MIKNLVLGVIILIITVFLLKKKKGMQKKLFISLIGMTITLTILVLPLYAEDIWISQFTFSLLYALQAIVLGQDFEMINSIPLDNLLNICYVVIILAYTIHDYCNFYLFEYCDKQSCNCRYSTDDS